MRILIISTLLLFCFSSKAQLCDTVKIDTIPCYIHSIDTTSYYDYYNPNGVLAWKKVKRYDATLIPPGGWAVFVGFANPYFTIVEGFAALRNYRVRRDTVEYCYVEAIYYMDKNYKQIKNRWITPGCFILVRKK